MKTKKALQAPFLFSIAFGNVFFMVESKMNCIKRLGERLISRTFERQVNELHIRAAILNRFTELGRPQTAAVA